MSTMDQQLGPTNFEMKGVGVSPAFFLSARDFLRLAVIGEGSGYTAVPVQVNYAFAVELFLKSFHAEIDLRQVYKLDEDEDGERSFFIDEERSYQRELPVNSGHDLRKLLNGLPPDLKKALVAKYERDLSRDLEDDLDACKDDFSKLRYYAEVGSNKKGEPSHGKPGGQTVRMSGILGGIAKFLEGCFQDASSYSSVQTTRLDGDGNPVP